jgi:hypothetical protein
MRISTFARRAIISIEKEISNNLFARRASTNVSPTGNTVAAAIRSIDMVALRATQQFNN